jgi:hypothetical protein
MRGLLGKFVKFIMLAQKLGANRRLDPVNHGLDMATGGLPGSLGDEDSWVEYFLNESHRQERVVWLSPGHGQSPDRS